MSANRIIVVIVAIALLVTGGLVTQSVIATAKTTSSIRESRAADADVARWVGLGEYYSKQSLTIPSSDTLRSRVADAARWEGLGKYYTDLNSAEAAIQAHAALVAAARYTGQALEQYELTGNKKALPACISTDVMAELPANIGDNHWKSVVPDCGQ
jgi:hypothetical protein